MKNLQKITKPRNLIAKDLRTPKYRMRVVQSEKSYNRKTENLALRKELSYG
jgi:hypothetical protein